MRHTTSIRVIVAVAVGVVVGVLFGRQGRWGLAASAGWVAAGLVFLAWTWWALRRIPVEATADHATREEPGKRVWELVLLVADLASLVSVAYLLVRAGQDDSSTQAWAAALAWRPSPCPGRS